LERRDDPENGAEQSDEGGGTGGRGQERQIALEPRHLQRRRPPQRALHDLEPRGRDLIAVVQHLIDDVARAAHLVVRGGVELGERALAQLPRAGLDDGGGPCLAVDLEKRERLPADAAELPPFLDDQRPAHDREDRQDHEDRLGDRPGGHNELEDAAGQRFACGHGGSFKLHFLRIVPTAVAACQ